MTRNRMALSASMLVIMLFCTGCTEVVGAAARSSLASFLTSVFSSAVNATLSGG